MVPKNGTTTFGFHLPSPEQALGAAWRGWRCLRYCSVFVVVRHWHRGPGAPGEAPAHLAWCAVGLGAPASPRGGTEGLLASPKSGTGGCQQLPRGESGDCLPLLVVELGGSCPSQRWGWGLPGSLEGGLGLQPQQAGSVQHVVPRQVTATELPVAGESLPAVQDTPVIHKQDLQERGKVSRRTATTAGRARSLWQGRSWGSLDMKSR